jgi:hypothetical protein
MFWRLRSPRQASAPPTATGPSGNPLPVAQVDTAKRYDVYCALAGEERVYEDVRFVGVRTFDRVSDYTPSFINGFLEIETADGARVLIPNFGIQMICEHGVPPAYKVVRQWGNW